MNIAPMPVSREDFGQLSQVDAAPDEDAAEAERTSLDAGDLSSVKSSVSEFEAMFLRLLLKEMMPQNGEAFFGHGPGAGIYKGLFLDALADQMASRGVLGTGKILERQIARNSANQPDVAGAIQPNRATPRTPGIMDKGT